MKRLVLPALLLVLFSAVLTAQQAQGLDPVPGALNISLPQANPRGIVSAAGAAPGDGESTRALPAKVDLQQFLPPVKNQGQIGSCAAWASVYYAKTIQENQERRWGADNADHQYSPLFTYNQITRGVNTGTAIQDHMVLMEKLGAAPFSTFPYVENLNVQPDASVLKAAEKYPASSHKNLDTYDSSTKTWSVKLESVKATLAEGLPVAGGFQVYENLYSYRGGIYNKAGGAASGGHAMCIIGYDDSKRALHLVNSWGTSWGDEGFLWMDYDLFETLCTYGCVVMYDTVLPVPESIQAPVNLEGSKGVYKNRIELSWTAVDGAELYIVYRVDNAEGVLKEVGRTDEPSWIEDELPPGVTYVYATKAAKKKGAGLLESDFSEIAEGWTAEEKFPPGIPSNLTFGFFMGNPVLVWLPVEEAEGYNIYRWSDADESFILLGRSKDSAFMDSGYKNLNKAGIVYYIVQAYNSNGEGYPTESLAVLKEIAEVKPEEEIIETDTLKDDIPAAKKEPFDGDFYRTDYFDYEYTVKQFREYYEKEMQAFRDFQKNEADSFEAWKRQHSR